MPFASKVGYHGMMIDTSVLDRITAELKPRAHEIVTQYGEMVTAEAAKRAPVATIATSGYNGGALRNSITSESGMTGELTYTVSDGVEYGIYQEFGTSVMAAQPFLVPAIEAWKDRFHAALAGLFK